MDYLALFTNILVWSTIGTLAVGQRRRNEKGTNVRDDVIRHAQANGQTVTPPAANDRLRVFWTNELRKALEEIARQAERVISHGDSNRRYAQSYASIVGVSHYSNDPVRELTEARDAYYKVERLMEQTFWLLTMDSELCEQIKLDARMATGERYAPFFAPKEK